MATREYAFIVGPETSTLPTVGTPSSEDDLVNLGFINTVTGTRAAPTAIVAGTGVEVSDVAREIIFIQGSGGAVDITADPQIEAPSSTGFELILIGRSNTNTVTLEHGTGLDLNGTYVMGEGDTIHLIYDGTNWFEVSRRES